MKTLHSVNLARLSVLEFGQHIKSILHNIKLLGDGFITDTVLANYLQALQSKTEKYDKAMLQIAKSDETARIVAADRLRDNTLVALNRQLSVYELSTNEDELIAFESLTTLFNTYKGIRKWNFEEESNGIDNLLVDLGNAKYRPYTTLLNMDGWVTILANNNTDFKKLFSNRTQEVSAKESYDVTSMRRDMKAVYDDMATYVLSMAKAKDAHVEYGKTLDVLNTVRKYYYDLLAKRKGNGKEDAGDAIPPMLN